MKKRNKNFHDSKNEVVIQKNIFFSTMMMLQTKSLLSEKMKK